MVWHTRKTPPPQNQYADTTLDEVFSASKRKLFDRINIMRCILAATAIAATWQIGSTPLFIFSLVLEAFCICWLVLSAYFLSVETLESYSSFIPTTTDILSLTIFVHFLGGAVSFIVLCFSGVTAFCSLNTKVKQGLWAAIFSTLSFAVLQFLYIAHILTPVNLIGAVHPVSVFEAIWSISGILIINITIFLVIHKLVKNLEEKNRVLEKEAMSDSLTGLPNRRALENRIEEEILRSIRYKHPLSRIMLDIDFFKRLNDTWGHEKGDICLGEVSELLVSHFRRGGDFIARYGGEEFIIVLPDTDLESCRNMLEKLNQRFAETAIPHPDSPLAPHITVSAEIGRAHV